VDRDAEYIGHARACVCTGKLKGLRQASGSNQLGNLISHDDGDDDDATSLRLTVERVIGYPR
jgi:hypothetical protein